jgi:hypothetical protein
VQHKPIPILPAPSQRKAGAVAENRSMPHLIQLRSTNALPRGANVAPDAFLQQPVSVCEQSEPNKRGITWTPNVTTYYQPPHMNRNYVNILPANGPNGSMVLTSSPPALAQQQTMSEGRKPQQRQFMHIQPKPAHLRNMEPPPVLQAEVNVSHRLLGMPHSSNPQPHYRQPNILVQSQRRYGEHASAQYYPQHPTQQPGHPPRMAHFAQSNGSIAGDADDNNTSYPGEIPGRANIRQSAPTEATSAGDIGLLNDVRYAVTR